MNKVILMGRLARDPELRYTQSGNIPQCTFAVAVDRPGKQPDGTTKADFLNCVAWRSTAEFISKYFVKGNRILLWGSVQTRDYTDKDGKKVYVTEIIVDNAEFCESKQTHSLPLTRLLRITASPATAATSRWILTNSFRSDALL